MGGVSSAEFCLMTGIQHTEKIVENTLNREGAILANTSEWHVLEHGLMYVNMVGVGTDSFVFLAKKCLL